MVKCSMLGMLLLVIFCQTLCAEPLRIEAVDIVVTTGIRDRMPVDAVESYAATVKDLYCFSRITGAQVDETIWHVWYHEGAGGGKGWFACEVAELENLVKKDTFYGIARCLASGCSGWPGADTRFAKISLALICTGMVKGGKKRNASSRVVRLFY